MESRNSRNQAQNAGVQGGLGFVSVNIAMCLYRLKYNLTSLIFSDVVLWFWMF